MEESTNTTAWTSSTSTTPSMISPSTGFYSWWHEDLQRQLGHRISSVSKCIVKGCEKFVRTVKTEYTMYSTKYSSNILASSNNITQSFWQTISSWQQEVIECSSWDSLLLSLQKVITPFSWSPSPTFRTFFNWWLQILVSSYKTIKGEVIMWLPDIS